jgi:heat shock protein HslJ
LVLLAAALGCGKQPPAREPPKAAAAVTITDRDWVLAELRGKPAPVGSGKQPVTLRLDRATSRAAGFGGCNRYGAQYSVAGDTGLTIGPAMSTKMFCADADDVERVFLAVLPAVIGYRATDSSLTLSGPGGPLARSRALRR